MACTHCGRPLFRSQWTPDSRWKSCPRCSRRHGEEHVFHRYPDAFGTTDARATHGRPEAPKATANVVEGVAPLIQRRHVVQRPDLSTEQRGLPGAEIRLDRLDAVHWLRGLPDACADLLITDPALRVAGKAPRRRLDHTPQAQQGIQQPLVPHFPNDRFPELLTECYRVLKHNRHCYIFSDQETMFVLKPIAEEVGFRFWKPIVWDKVSMGMGYHYRAQYEFILFFEKGKRKLNNLGVPDILAFKRLRNGYPHKSPWGW